MELPKAVGLVIKTLVFRLDLPRPLTGKEGQPFEGCQVCPADGGEPFSIGLEPDLTRASYDYDHRLCLVAWVKLPGTRFRLERLMFTGTRVEALDVLVTPAFRDELRTAFLELLAKCRGEGDKGRS